MIIRSSHSNRSGLIIGLIQGLMTAELFDEEKTSVVQFPQCLDSWEWQTACLNLTSDTGDKMLLIPFKRVIKLFMLVSLQINQERPESQLISRSLKILMSDLTIGGFPDLPRISNSKLSEQHQNYTGNL